MEEGEALMLGIRRVRNIFVVDKLDGTESRWSSFADAALALEREAGHLVAESMPQNEGVVH